MRCWPAVSFLALAITLGAGAQRGGHVGGGAGHVSATGPHMASPTHSGAGFGSALRSGFTHTTSPGAGAQRPGFLRPAYGSRPSFAGRPYGNLGAGFRGRPSVGAGVVSPARPSFFGHSHAPYGGYGDRRNRFGAPFFAYPGFVDIGFLNPYIDPFWDDFYDDDTAQPWGDSAVPGDAFAANQPYPGVDPTAAPSPGPEVAAPPLTADPAGGTAAPIPFVGPYRSSRRAQPAPPPEEDAVTLIFKDGRPAEQVRNYALTRTTLVIPGRRLREIPLDQLDLPATERVNRQAGVDFSPPMAP